MSNITVHYCCIIVVDAVNDDDDDAALDRRLQQLSTSNADITPHKNIHLLDQLTAQQKKNQLALMQLQQQMHVLNTSRCV